MKFRQQFKIPIITSLGGINFTNQVGSQETAPCWQGI